MQEYAVPLYLTAKELSKFDGTNGNPIYLAVKGKIYDVSAGAQYYGPNGSYRFFAAKDASRSFVTGCFQDECFEDGLDGLTPEQMKEVDRWADFYENHEEYQHIGYLKQE